MNTATKRTFGIAAAAAVVILVMWFMVFFRPQSHKLSNLHNQSAQASQQISQLDTEIGQMKALLPLIPADQKALAKLKAAVPDNPSLSDAIDQLHAAATHSGVSLTSIGPSTPSAATGSAKTTQGTPAITLSLTAAGTYQQMMAFIDALDSAPRTFVIDRLGLSGAPQLTATMSVRVFYTGTPSH